MLPPCRGTNARKSRRNNDVAEMSTRELKETISKLHEAQEQLTYHCRARDELAKKQSEHEDLSDTVRRLREAESGVRKARRDGHARPTAKR